MAMTVSLIAFLSFVDERISQLSYPPIVKVTENSARGREEKSIGGSDGIKVGTLVGVSVGVFVGVFVAVLLACVVGVFVLVCSFRTFGQFRG